MSRLRLIGSALVALLLLTLATPMIDAVAAPAKDPLCVAKPSIESGPRILTIGDSLTSAAAGDYTWRYFLWKHLVTKAGKAVPAAGRVNFVGPSTYVVDPIALTWSSSDYVCDFDKDHYAVPGTFLARYLKPVTIGSTTYSSGIKAQVKSRSAGVLLVFAGINDLSRGQDITDSPDTPTQVLASAKKVLVEARAANPKIKVVFAYVPTSSGTPAAGSLQAHLKAYNAKLAAAVPGWSTTNSRVVLAKTAQNWGKPDLTYDGIHPNVQGEVKIATDFAKALHAVGVGPGPQAVPNLSAYLGPRKVAALTAPIRSGSTVTLSWTLPPGSVRTRIERRDVTAGQGWTIRGEKGLIDVARCTDAAGHAVTNGAQAPYTCTYKDSGFVAGHQVQYRLRSARGPAGTGAQNPATQPFLYAASLRSAVRTVG